MNGPDEIEFPAVLAVLVQAEPDERGISHSAWAVRKVEDPEDLAPAIVYLERRCALMMESATRKPTVAKAAWTSDPAQMAALLAEAEERAGQSEVGPVFVAVMRGTL